MAPLPAPLPPLPDGLDLDRFLKNLTDPMNIIDRDYRVLWTNDPDPGPGRPRFRAEGKICYRVFMEREEPCEECPIRSVFESGRPEVMEKTVRVRLGPGPPHRGLGLPHLRPRGRAGQGHQDRPPHRPGPVQAGSGQGRPKQKRRLFPGPLRA